MSSTWKKTLLRVMGLFCVLTCLAVSPVVAQETIVIQSDEWCPHNCDPAEGVLGYMVDIAKAVFEPQGIAVTYELNDWDASIENAQQGACDAIVGAGLTEAEGLIYPTKGQGSSKMIYLARADSDMTYTGVDALAGKVIGVIEGYSYDEGPLDEYIAANAGDPSKVHVESGDTPLETNISLLMDGKVDMIVADAAVVEYKLFVMKLADMVKMVGSDEEDEIFMAFSPKNPNAQKYADMLDQGMDALRASGELQTIMSNYGLKDWK